MHAMTAAISLMLASAMTTAPGGWSQGEMHLRHHHNA